METESHEDLGHLPITRQAIVLVCELSGSFWVPHTRISHIAD
jgi:hypothetical protein